MITTMFCVACVLSFLLGVILTPMIIFLRARRDKNWDNSNMANIYRVFSHLATHPSDFGLFQYPDGSRPFWYIKCDEFDEVVKTRPNSK